MSNRATAINLLVRSYQELGILPSPVAGRIHNKSTILPWSTTQLISTQWSQRNLERGKVSNFNSTYEVLDKNVRYVSTIDTSNELLSRLSPSEKLRCVIRKVTDGSTDKQYFELWEQGRLIKNFDLSVLELHGDVYTDDEFGSLQWSRDENQIVYVAEKKKPKTEPFYKPGSKPKDGDDQPIKGEEFTYTEEWGEQMAGKSQPTIALYNIKDDQFSILSGVPDDYSPGQILWTPDNSGVFGIAVNNLPRRLGIIYCTNREGVVFQLSLAGEFSVVSTVASPRSCRLSPDGKTLVWLQRPPGGPHDGCEELVLLNLDTRQIQTVIPIIRERISIGNDLFYGIYGGRLPTRCFLKNSSIVVFDTIQKFSQVVYTVNLNTQEITKIAEGRTLDALDSEILVVKASPIESPHLELLNVDNSSIVRLTEPLKRLELAEYIKIDLTQGSDGGEFNCILLKPPIKDSTAVTPLVVFPHGGPHSAFVDTFMVEPAIFVQFGFAVLMVNYRGSTGFGQSSVEALLGKIGDMDVKDVHYAATYALKTYPALNPDKVVAYGGSHGGFLSLHLSGQYPDFYKAVVVRNPVVDLPSMFETSDIPDWVSVEAGSRYAADIDPPDSDVAAMARVSPMRLIGAVKAPTLLMIGSNDLRVPPFQSIHYYRVLKASGIKTKLHVYKDNHPLGTVPVHIDALINGILWISDNIDYPIQ